MSAVVIAYATCPDAGCAERIARALVEERLAACVQALPGLVSMYRWEGEVQHGNEVLLLIKTTRDRLDALKLRLPALHPYAVPELLVVDVSDGLPTYLDWVRSETRPV